MELSLSAQGLLIVYAVGAGIAIGILYDFFRIFRMAFGAKPAAIFVEDLIFWLVCAIGAFLFFMCLNEGQIRLYCFPGFAAGACIYFLTFSRFIIKISRFFINKMKKIIKFVLHLIGKPIIILDVKIKRLTESVRIKSKKRKAEKKKASELKCRKIPEKRKGRRKR